MRFRRRGYPRRRRFSLRRRFGFRSRMRRRRVRIGYRM
jgi:hypothetical protein